LAARELGWEEIDASFVDVSDEEATRIVLVDNRTSDLATYDDELLAELLEGLGDLAGTGFDDQALDELLDQVAPPPLEEEPPPLPEEPATRPGELYALGEHRLLCGDACDAGDLERVMGGEQASVLWTDPPYGVGYEGRTRARLTLENDREEGLDSLLREAFCVADRALAPGAALYVLHPAGPLGHVFTAAFLAQGWSLRQTLVWVKDALVLGHADYPLPPRADPARLQTGCRAPRARGRRLVRRQFPAKRP
jgi:ParB-like chromosome segregation protein Spo0J